ncbi:asparagine synthase-related protein [Maridesulfovibrio frigidus]|uniref:asparagine synthase-related protein n=1 Tax=Maridesulfovibrio frigidus TaxID=340956 RepID=UPI00068B2EE1|nr:ATP-dependent sacrificial sulfur transferase LarE [Maridesulfovibrio frigidus]
MPTKKSIIIQKQYDMLLGLFRSHKKAFIAFSGGIDSSLVAKAAFDVLGANAVAITVDSDLVARRDLNYARKSAASIGIRHKIVRAELLNITNITENSPLRCYHCKKNIIESINLFPLFDGSHIDDCDSRPGMKAIKEAGVISPLALAGFGKEIIAETAFYLRLTSAGRPSNSCLATRITTGQPLTATKLCIVEQIEEIMFNASVNWCRARMDQLNLTIEYGSEELLTETLIADELLSTIPELISMEVHFLRRA